MLVTVSVTVRVGDRSLRRLDDRLDDDEDDELLLDDEDDEDDELLLDDEDDEDDELLLDDEDPPPRSTGPLSASEPLVLRLGDELG